MGDPLGSFLRERASEDKARWKDSCWFVGTVGQIWDVTRLLLLIEQPGGRIVKAQMVVG